MKMKIREGRRTDQKPSYSGKILRFFGKVITEKKERNYENWRMVRCV
jgi:hypothetical protein